MTERIAEPVSGPPCASRYLTLAMMKTATKPMPSAGSPASAQVFSGRAASLSLRYCGSRSLRIVVIGLATKIDE